MSEHRPLVFQQDHIDGSRRRHHFETCYEFAEQFVFIGGRRFGVD